MHAYLVDYARYAALQIGGGPGRFFEQVRQLVGPHHDRSEASMEAMFRVLGAVLQAQDQPSDLAPFLRGWSWADWRGLEISSGLQASPRADGGDEPQEYHRVVALETLEGVWVAWQQMSFGGSSLAERLAFEARVDRRLGRLGLSHRERLALQALIQTVQDSETRACGAEQVAALLN